MVLYAGVHSSGYHAPMYGMAAKLPVRRLVARNVRKVIADLYKPTAGSTP